ncbi:MAG: GxxExxY protein [Sphingobacteriales bacterium]|nr:GxxExxY protein [Sphingobacteriales bacterium]
MLKDELNIIASQIVNAAYEVHKELGPGLLESIYQICFVQELRNVGLIVEQQVMIPVIYKNQMLSKDFFIDVLVENEIVVELKAVEALLPVHEAQLISYLKLADKKLGFLINFNVPKIKEGIKRKINGYFE